MALNLTHPLWRTLFVTVLAAGVLVAGCAELGDNDDAPALASVSETYVDPVSGSDATGTGTISSPYRTITFAATKSVNLVLLPGEYTAANGEQFPLILPSGSSLRGSRLDTANGIFARISGTGLFTSVLVPQPQQVAVVLRGRGAIVASLFVEAPGGVAIWDEGTGASIIINSQIKSSGIGVVLAGQTTQLRGNTISGNVASGLEVLRGASPKLFRNTISSNGVGITIQTGAHPIFRAASDSGENVIRSNTACDFRHLGEADLDLTGTVWDDDVFNFVVKNACTGGSNITVEGVGAVNYQVIPSSTTLLFPSTRRINLLTPSFGELLASAEPALSWVSGGSRLAAAAIMDKPPVLGPHGVANVGDIVWFWHTGLGTGATGSIRFSDGRVPTNGDVFSTQRPQPLLRGRSYYWATWEWDDSGQNIIGSSTISYFRVSN